MKELRLISDEEAVIVLVRTIGLSENPSGMFRDTLAFHGLKMDLKSMKKSKFLSIRNYSGSLAYFSSMLQLTTRAKNLYKTKSILYKWNY